MFDKKQVPLLPTAVNPELTLYYFALTVGCESRSLYSLVSICRLSLFPKSLLLTKRLTANNTLKILFAGFRPKNIGLKPFLDLSRQESGYFRFHEVFFSMALL